MGCVVDRQSPVVSLVWKVRLSQNCLQLFLWFKRPEVGVTVAVYVPAGVPFVVVVSPELPPLDLSVPRTRMSVSMAAAMAGDAETCRRRLAIKSPITLLPPNNGRESRTCCCAGAASPGPNTLVLYSYEIKRSRSVNRSFQSTKGRYVPGLRSSLFVGKNSPYGATTARAAAVSASCDAIWLQSRSPRTKAPVGSL